MNQLGVWIMDNVYGAQAWKTLAQQELLPIAVARYEVTMKTTGDMLQNVVDSLQQHHRTRTK